MLNNRMKEYIIYLLYLTGCFYLLNKNVEEINRVWNHYESIRVLIHPLLFICTALIVAFFFLIFDTNNMKNKIQERNMVFNQKQKQQVVITTVINWFIGRPFAYFMLHLVTNNQNFQLESILMVLFKYFIIILLYEIWFYYFHRFLHNKTVYKYVHKYHHIPKIPTVWATYCIHPLETIGHGLFFSILQFFCQLHPIYLMILDVIIITNETNSHSGYLRKYLPNPEYHDMHHQLVTCNYGLSDYLDKFHGTYKSN
jgi:sterol desaturase/sphingolipid hydroxylase (fatty acid hydroxylase superfamily)